MKMENVKILHTVGLTDTLDESKDDPLLGFFILNLLLCKNSNICKYREDSIGNGKSSLPNFLVLLVVVIIEKKRSSEVVVLRR